MNARIITLSDWLVPCRALTEKGNAAYCINLMSVLKYKYTDTDTTDILLWIVCVFSALYS